MALLKGENFFGLGLALELGFGLLGSKFCLDFVVLISGEWVRGLGLSSRSVSSDLGFFSGVSPNLGLTDSGMKLAPLPNSPESGVCGRNLYGDISSGFNFRVFFLAKAIVLLLASVDSSGCPFVNGIL